MSSLDLLRLLIGCGFLLYASALDVRTRRVPNGIWVRFALLALLLFLADAFVVGRLHWQHALVSLALIALAYVLWYLHLLAGGADAKAMMALAILLPMPIQWTWSGAAFPLWQSPLPGALTVLSNSVLLFAFAPLVLFLHNLVRGHLSLPAMFLGYTMPIDRAARSFVWIVDRVDAQGQQSQVLFPSRTNEQDYSQNLQRLQQAGFKRVWVTPKIPFMVPLLVGFTTAFLLGDLLFRSVEALVEISR